MALLVLGYQSTTILGIVHLKVEIIQILRSPLVTAVKDSTIQRWGDFKVQVQTQWLSILIKTNKPSM